MADLQEYQDEFIRFRNELTSFVYRLVPNRQDSEDIVQDTYVKAFKNLDTFRGDSSFKTWVFTIALNRARDILKKRPRWTEDFQDICRSATYASQEIQAEMADISMNSPHGRFVLREHIDYCFTCIAKTLLLEEQVCLILKEIYQFKVQEIMRICDLSEGKVKHALASARKRLVHIFEQRCALVGKQGACHQCSELNGMFNPRQNFEEAAMKLKMVRERERADYDRLLELRLELVRAIDPLNAEGSELHNYMLEGLPGHAAAHKQ